MPGEIKPTQAAKLHIIQPGTIVLEQFGIADLGIITTPKVNLILFELRQARRVVRMDVGVHKCPGSIEVRSHQLQMHKSAQNLEDRLQYKLMATTSD